MDTIEWFKYRWDQLGDISELLKVAAPRFTDPNVYLKELILEEDDQELADKRLRILENLVIQDEEKKLEIDLKKGRLLAKQYLSETDYTQLSDYPCSQDKRKEYRAYRKYLRGVLDKHPSLDLMNVYSLKDWMKWCSDNRNNPALQLFTVY